MMEYFDSSMAMSAICTRSTRHADARSRLAAAEEAFIINHGLAEVYRTLSGQMRIPPAEAAAAVENMAQHFKEAPLTRQDYLETVQDLARRGLAGRLTFDALHARGARKVGADKVHTYDPDDFRQVEPTLPLP
jgi:predicted nucleic acid-binding protein